MRKRGEKMDGKHTRENKGIMKKNCEYMKKKIQETVKFRTKREKKITDKKTVRGGKKLRDNMRNRKTLLNA